MEIIRGKIPGAKKVVIYGPEGIGKSTLASHFPEPLFIDTEGGTKELDVARTQKPTSWKMLLSMIGEIKATPSLCRTLVIDTIDWAEQLCIQYVCAEHHKDGLESFGYGTGYVFVKEEFTRFLGQLSALIDAGINVVLTAHAQIRKFEQPDEMGAYDRWELKLGKKTSSQTAPLVKEWCDLLLFCNYKTYSVATDDKARKFKAQGGERVIYTSHNPCWDAKNRYNLPGEIAMDYAEIASIIEPKDAPKPAETEAPAPSAPAPKPAKAKPKEKAPEATAEKQATPAVSPLADAMNPPEADAPEKKGFGVDVRIPKNLRDLMVRDQIDEWDIQNAVESRGYFTSDVPVYKYPQTFIDGCLVGAWDTVKKLIKEIKENEEIPWDWQNPMGNIND